MTKKDWPKLAEHFVSNYFPTLGRNDVVMRDELVSCVAEAMEEAGCFDLPNEPMGEWVAIEEVPFGTRVVAPLNKGIGYLTGTVKMCPYGTGKRVVSDGQSFVSPSVVKRLLNLVNPAA